MIGFLRKPRGRQSLTNSLESERQSHESLQTQGKPASTTSASIVDQKIHPDLDALVEALSLSGKPADPATPSRSTSYRDPTPTVAPLRPRSRSRLTEGREGATGRPHIRTSDLSGVTPDQSSTSIATPLSASDSRQWSPMIKGSTGDLSSHSPRGGSILADLPGQEEQNWWSTFGKTRLRALSYGSDAALNYDRHQVPDSPDPMNPDETWYTAPSYHTNYHDPQTPRSRSQSFCCSTPHSRSRSYQSTTRSSPPGTFGVRTPPRSGTSLKYDHRHNDESTTETHFGFREPPPPLPPLDHPAFHSQASTQADGRQNTFPKSTQRRNELSKFVHAHHSARNSHSLSSLQRLKKDSLPVTTTPDRSSRRYQSGPLDRYAETDVVEPDVSVEGSPSKKASRSMIRLLGKKSKSNVRRRSAEYSAKQAASAGYDPTFQECWEVQVSREMVRLALGNSQGMVDPGMPPHDGASFSGKARGNNRFPGAVSDLGSPITLPDPPRSPPPKLNDTLSRDFSQVEFSTASFSRYLFPELFTSRDNDVMADENANAPVTTSSRTSSRARRTTGASADDSPPSSPGSVSRRGGGRAMSSPSRTRTPSPKPRVDTASFFSSIGGSSNLLAAPTVNVIGATPEASPVSPAKRAHHKSTPTKPSPSVLKTPSTPPIMEKSYSSGSAKRKAEEAGVAGDKTPPKEAREHRTTFAPEPRTHRSSVSSAHAPSSYNRSKRVRLTDMSDTRPGSSRSASGTGTLVTPNDSPPNAKSTGSWSSRGSHTVSYNSHPNSHTLHAPPASSGFHAPPLPPQAHRSPSRRSLSQASIPISALVSPHAPSVATSGHFHMRDPRKPPKIQPTPWTLSFPAAVRHDESRWARNSWVERGGSPVHAWCFFLGFIIFPLWWFAAVMSVHKTRRLGGDAEKGSVLLDDPQLEFDSRSWRTRCRIMSGVSLVTYIPFIVLVAVFA